MRRLISDMTGDPPSYWTRVCEVDNVELVLIEGDKKELRIENR
jgi:hypothetical protein